MSKLPILVVGAGLGGAMAALSLGRKGFDVLVLEEAEEFGVIGYGIQLGPNVFWMLDRLGVADAVLAVALRPKSLVMYDWVDGTAIARIPTRESFVKRFGKPYVVIHRVDLHRVLLERFLRPRCRQPAFRRLDRRAFPRPARERARREPSARAASAAG